MTATTLLFLFLSDIPSFDFFPLHYFAPTVFKVARRSADVTIVIGVYRIEIIQFLNITNNL